MGIIQPDIFNHLLLSKNKGFAIHIKLKSENQYVITAIDELIDNQVTIKPISLHGSIIQITSFPIDDVEVARCLNVLYNSPVYKELREIKASIRCIKEAILKPHSRA